MSNTINNSSFIREMLTALDVPGVLSGEDVRIRSCDPFRNRPSLSPALLRPRSTAEVSTILAAATAHHQPIVTHGGRTGVSGGAFASAEEIIVSLERMSAIEEIDTYNNVAVVQAGATLESIHRAVAERDLFYPVDLGARGTATIGGNIATNAGGNRVVRWGTTRSNVLGLEAVLSNGSVISSMNRLVKNNTGYDLKHFFIGSEGTLGIITRAVLRLAPMPSSQAVALVSVKSYDNLLALLSKARRLSTLSAFEAMWLDYYEIIAAYQTNMPLPADQPYYVLIESMGYNATLDNTLFEEFLAGVYQDGLIQEAVTAGSDQQIADLWSIRERSECIKKEFGAFVPTDISLDVRSIEQFRDAFKSRLQSRYTTARVATVGHLGDNNIHMAINVGPNTLDEEEGVEKILYDTVREFEGAITAEHGIGQLKRKFLPEHRSKADMALMRQLRGTFDPLHLLNRDVLFSG
jgi:FAD/FMN-containing dehydrogenase